MRKIFLWVGLFLVVRLCLAAEASAVPIQGLFSTGVDAAGAVLSDESPEVHYALTGPSSPAIVAAPHSMWVTAPAGSAWIGPTAGTINDPVGTYVYTLAFDLTGLDSSTASINGQWASDDSGLIFLNGVNTGLQSLSQVELLSFEISSGFNPGQNTLAFEIINAPGSELPGWNPTSLFDRGALGKCGAHPRTLHRTPLRDWTGGAGDATKTTYTEGVLRCGSLHFWFWWWCFLGGVRGRVRHLSSRMGLSPTIRSAVTRMTPVEAEITELWTAQRSLRIGLEMPTAAYSFDGVDDFIEPGSHFAGYPEFSQLIWVKPASPVSGGETRIIQAGVGGIYLDTTLDELIFEMLFDRVGGTANGNSYSTRFLYQTPASVAGNDWYHLALIGHSNNDLDVYINGALAHSGAGVTDDGQNSNYENSLIGAGHPHQLSPGVNFKFFSGDIDDVYVYDRALSPAEVQTLYSAIPRTLHRTPLRGWNDGTGDATKANAEGVLHLSLLMGSRF